uniref:Uncharacterized protein n=1 Tax=Anguilla anguilla TaxID=7936 RepID=A0A0E9S9Q3_ANGAN
MVQMEILIVCAFKMLLRIVYISQKEIVKPVVL